MTKSKAILRASRWGLLIPLSCSGEDLKEAPSTAKVESGTTGSGGLPDNHSPITDDNELYVPKAMVVSRLGVERPGLNITASTLLNHEEGAEFYAAVRNTGDSSACDASLSVEFFDHEGRSVANEGGAVYGGTLYRPLNVTVSSIICLDPGETGTAVISQFSQDVQAEELANAVYVFSYFNQTILPFDVIAAGELNFGELEPIPHGAEIAFRGTLTSKLDVTLEGPKITVFTATRHGRPFGMWAQESEAELAPGASLQFETSALGAPGDHAIAYATGIIKL